MSVIKRLSATLSATVDKWVGDIENHDAVIEAAIHDARQSTARAKVRMGRLQREGEQLEERLQQLCKDEARWLQRAQGMAEQDEEKALACLQRRKACQQQILDTEQVVKRHQAAQTKLEEQVRQAETRLQEMIRNRNTLRARESVAEASTTLAKFEDRGVIDSEAAFERWETRVMEHELGMESEVGPDSLEQSFVVAEERDQLLAELHQLTEQGKNDD
ncbi:MAG: PspA/IM30 family protein [Candidatus Thiodiazotropha sp. (ex Dulcina madagascariensis)]|nr:PspA/IM30 family protein [Candidatus Thiodiazotropha sp. (ex Dulcina madagascariensis)]